MNREGNLPSRASNTQKREAGKLSDQHPGKRRASDTPNIAPKSLLLPPIIRNVEQVDLTVKSPSKATKFARGRKRKINDLSEDRGLKRNAKDVSHKAGDDITKTVDLTGDDGDTEVALLNAKKKPTAYGEDGEKRLRK
jgi:hypothetical protein